jgi:hypothetical protein
MIISDELGNYIKLIEQSDLNDIRSAFSDWRTSNLNRVMLGEAYRNSLKIGEAGVIARLSNILPRIPVTIWVYCLADNTPVAALICEFEGNPTTKVGLHAIAVRPEYRGSGNFLNFIRMFTWLVNKRLKLERAEFEVFTDVTQVSNIVSQLSGKEIATIKANDKASFKTIGALDRKKVADKLDNFLGSKTFTTSIPEVSKEARYRVAGTMNSISLDMEWEATGDTVVISRPLNRWRG